MTLGTVWRILKALNIFKQAQTEVSNMQPNAPKPWYTSMTIVWSALSALLVNFTPELQVFISAHPKLATVITALAGILLRFKTDKPVA